jgi:hypothetical protein
VSKQLEIKKGKEKEKFNFRCGTIAPVEICRVQVFLRSVLQLSVIKLNRNTHKRDIDVPIY